MPEDQAQNQLRVGLYVDGFNLYHALDKIGEPWLKWLDLWRLGENLSTPNNGTLTRTVFCTAIPDHVPEASRDRHLLYMAALQGAGVDVVKGHYIFNADLNRYTEKQSDINVALELITDALADKIDIAMLLSADSDQAATARVFRDKCGEKTLISIAPPGQTVSKKIASYASKSFVLSKMQIDLAVFPQNVTGLKRPITRPEAYNPPSWWIHPDDRP